MTLRNKMLDMLNTTRVEELHEIAGEILIVVSRAIMTKANVYLWAEDNLHLYVRLFKSWGLHVNKVVCFWTKEFKQVDDVEIISPKDLLEDKTPRKLFFLEAFSYRISNPEEFWKKWMQALSPSEFYQITPSAKAALVSNFDCFDSDKMYYYQSHKQKIMELFDSLVDETSKQTLYHYVESYVRNCAYKGEHNPTRWKYFFGGKYERLYKHLDGECWINCGASVGDTIFAYLSFDFKPKKIYAFEGDTQTYTKLLNNLSLLPPDKRELVEPINELIDEKTDFEKILNGNKCTLLNADIEGAEMNLLRAMKNIIQADRPVIAICLYHLKEDLLSIPQFLQNICENYIYHIRKYTPYHGYLKKNGELVLYAVPVERATLITPPPNHFYNQ